MSVWFSVYASGTRVSGHRFRPGHEALDVAPNTPMDLSILGQLDGVVIDYGADHILTVPGSGSRGIWVRINHDDGTSVEHCHLAGVPWPVDDRYHPDHAKGNPIGRRVLRGKPTGFHTGMTGDTNGYHDHLIARDANGQRVDPEPLLFREDDVNATPEQLATLTQALNTQWGYAQELKAKGSMSASREVQAGSEIEAAVISIKDTLRELGVEL